ncbi:hypothetical protein NMY22_g12127 [Coprinellus aureogranulatus]|nr:hypothetical protein NMY22_g12127 [Coprinellus aureogranulatus]
MAFGNTSDTLGPAFAGYTIGAILFGVTLLQAYHYFMTNSGNRYQMISVIIILVLDTLHFAFAIHMLFNFLLAISGNPHHVPWVIWSLKVVLLQSLVFFVLYVQGMYLHKMWMYINKNRDGPSLLSSRFRRWLKAYVVLLAVLAVGVGVLFLVELQKINDISNFSMEFTYVIYVGFGTACLVDLGIAVAMCLMLYKSSGGITRKSNLIVTKLIQYIVGTGLLTSLGALMCMVLYIAKPISLLYLGVEYSMTRLYAISILAHYNSQNRLREQWNEPAEVKGKSLLYFNDPEKFAQTGQSSDLETRSEGYYGRSGGRAGHRRRTSSLPPDTPESWQRPLSRNKERRYIFHEHEETLVQQSPHFGRRSASPPARKQCYSLGRDTSSETEL